MSLGKTWLKSLALREVNSLLVKEVVKQKLIIIRHAPTDANSKGIFMGFHDAPSSESGLLAARELGKLLNIGADLRLFTSPLSRSKATLDSICPNGKKIVDARLRERGLGEWEGCLLTAVRDQYPDAFGDDNSLDPFYTPPNGEHTEQFVSRVCDFLTDISTNQIRSTALVVTHNGVIAVMRSLIEERPLRDCFGEVEPFLTPRTYTYEADRLLQFLPRIIETLHQSQSAGE
jgi:broad specificity phosphatase PhoE